MRTKRPPYHHGDLRTALIKVAAEMIAEQGMESVTLRALSERIGVSRTAPYRHFADKAALLAAVAEEGFKRLYKRMQMVLQEFEADTIGRFQKMGVAYIQFAVENPTHYRLMLSCEAEGQDNYPDLAVAGQKVFDLLVETIQQGQKNGRIKSGEPFDLAIIAWAMVHGLAALIIDEQIHATADIENLVVFAMRSLVEGLMPR